MGDFVENMLRNVMLALMTGNRTLVGNVSRTDNVVDHLNEAIKLYVTKLTRESLDERDGKRAMEIISFAINLEHIGDIIDKNLCELATKKIKRRIEFSPDGAAELEAFHKRIVDSLRLGFSVFMSGDAADARKLIAQKAEIRSAELAAAERHFERLARGPLPIDRNHLAPPRHPAGFEADSLPYLLGGLSGPGGGRGDGSSPHRLRKATPSPCRRRA